MQLEQGRVEKVEAGRVCEAVGVGRGSRVGLATWRRPCRILKFCHLFITYLELGTHNVGGIDRE